MMQDYVKGPIIGEGTYGSVIRATHKESGRSVAIKKVRVGSTRDGVHVSALREIRALRELGCGGCPNIVSLLDVFPNKAGTSLCLVFEYLDWSLEDIVRDRSLPIDPAAVKSYAHMLLSALAHVHSVGLVHRDVKPDNLLVHGASGTLKLADFGLARSCSGNANSSGSSGMSLPRQEGELGRAGGAAAAVGEAQQGGTGGGNTQQGQEGGDDEDGKWTHQVFGRWYRPPELLFGATRYGPAVDMWAAGCVVAELMLRRPWFAGSCDMDQLDRIFGILGVPTPEDWPGMADLPHRLDFKPAPGVPLERVFPQASPACLDLLKGLMAFDPARRLTAAQALQHPWFTEEPVPAAPQQLPRPASGRRGMTLAIPAVLAEMVAGLPRGPGGRANLQHPLHAFGITGNAPDARAAGGEWGAGEATAVVALANAGAEATHQCIVEQQHQQQGSSVADAAVAAEAPGAAAVAALQPRAALAQGTASAAGAAAGSGPSSASLMAAGGFRIGSGGEQPSMRPPPHRASLGGGGLQRRRLSDLNAALSGAAAAAAGSGGGGAGGGGALIWGAASGGGGGLFVSHPLQHQQPYPHQQQHAGDPAGGDTQHAAPVSLMADSAASLEAPATSEGACPMSLGSTALKRSRTAFESDGKWPIGGGAGGGMRTGSGGRGSGGGGRGGGGGSGVRAGSEEPDEMDLGSTAAHHQGAGVALGGQHAGAEMGLGGGGGAAAGPHARAGDLARSASLPLAAAAAGASGLQQAAVAGAAAAAPGGGPVAPASASDGQRLTGGPMSLDISACEALRGLFRPRLDSDELVYLRQRTLDLDEALLQASHHEAQGGVGGGGGLFSSVSPMADGATPEAAGTAAAAADSSARRGPDQSPQHKRRATPASMAAASALAATPESVSLGVASGSAGPGGSAGGVGHGLPDTAGVPVDCGPSDAGDCGFGCVEDIKSAGSARPRRVLSELQQEQMLLAAQQLAERQRQAQFAAWAAAATAGGDSGDAAGAAAAGPLAAQGAQAGPGGNGRGGGAGGRAEEEEMWSPLEPGAIQGTGRVLFS